MNFYLHFKKMTIIALLSAPFCYNVFSMEDISNGNDLKIGAFKENLITACDSFETKGQDTTTKMARSSLVERVKSSTLPIKDLANDIVYFMNEHTEFSVKFKKYISNWLDQLISDESSSFEIDAKDLKSSGEPYCAGEIDDIQAHYLCNYEDKIFGAFTETLPQITEKNEIKLWVKDRVCQIIINLNKGNFGYRWSTMNNDEQKILEPRIIEALYIALSQYDFIGNITDEKCTVLICGSFIWGEKDSISDIDIVGSNDFHSEGLCPLYGGRDLLLGIDAISLRAARVKLSTYVSSIALNNPILLSEETFGEDARLEMLSEIDGLIKFL